LEGEKQQAGESDSTNREETLTRKEN